MKISRFLRYFLLVSFFWPVFSQVTEAEMQLKANSGNGSTHAVVLREECILNDRYSVSNLKEFRHVKIKVFTKKGIEDFGVLKLMQAGGRKIKDFKGTVYLPDGHVIKLSKDDIKFKKVKKEWGATVKEMSVVFPGLVPGSIIEYSYERKKDHLTGLYKWEFSNPVHTIYSEIRFLPSKRKAWAYYSQNPGAKAEVIQKEQEVTIIRKDIPPFTDEEFSLPKNSLKDAIVLYYIYYKPETYWTDWGDRYFEQFAKEIKPCRRSKKMVKKEFAEIPRKELLKVIYDFVQNHYLPIFTLTSEELEIHKKEISKLFYASDMSSLLSLKVLAPQQIMKVLACLIQTALPEAKIEVAHFSPWYSNVFNREIKSISQLPEELLKVTLDGEEHWMSPGKRLLPYGLVSYGAKGSPLLLVGPHGSSFQVIQRDPYKDNVTIKQTEVKITEEDRAVIKETQTLDPYMSYIYRTLLIHLKKEESRDIFEGLLEKSYGSDFELIKWDYRNLEDIEKPFILEFEFSYPYEFEEVGDRLLLDLVGLDRKTENPFSSEGRKGIIIFDYPSMIKQEIHYSLPEGYALVSLPEYKEINKQEFVYRMKFEKENDRSFFLKILQVIQVSAYPADRAPFFAETFSKMIRAHDQKMVIEERD